MERHLRKHKLAFTFANEVSVRRELHSSAEAKNFALRLWWHVKHVNDSLHHSCITEEDLQVGLGGLQGVGEGGDRLVGGLGWLGWVGWVGWNGRMGWWVAGGLAGGIACGLRLLA